MILGGLGTLYLHLPTSFLPQEDRGVFMTQIQLPVGATQQETLKVVDKVENYLLVGEGKNVQSVFSIVGAGPGGNGQNVVRMFVRFKPWEQRTGDADSAGAIIERTSRAFANIREARVFASSPPAISGLGSSAGFDLELEDHGGLGHDALMQARDRLLTAAARQPELTRVRHNGMDDSPQLQVDIDQRKAQALGISIDDINNTLKTAWAQPTLTTFSTVDG